MSTKQLTPANKDEDYMIPVSETGFYHIRFVEKTATANPEIFIESTRVQTFSIAGFKGYLEHKNHFSYQSEVILHDPTYAPKVTEHEPAKTQQPPAIVPPEPKPKKRVHRKSTKN